MKLYYSPGACSISPNVSLREAEIPFELVRVDLAKKLYGDHQDFTKINPKGYVPALELDDGTILTEGQVLVQWIADQKPEKKLLPLAGTIARIRVQEWLAYIATELHKGTSPLYSPKINAEYKAALTERLVKRFAILMRAVEDKKFLMGDDFTVADPYAFYVLRGWKRFGHELSPAAAAYFDRVMARPSVKAALEAEG